MTEKPDAYDLFMRMLESKKQSDIDAYCRVRYGSTSRLLTVRDSLLTDLEAARIEYKSVLEGVTQPLVREQFLRTLMSIQSLISMVSYNDK